MSIVSIDIENIKCIKKAELEIPFDKGVYGIIGNNGCGKSTILVAIAQLISRHNLGTLKEEDFNSESKVVFTYEEQSDVWTYSDSQGMWVANTFPKTKQFKGMHEGSLFYGKRFDESKKVDALVQRGAFASNEIVEADDYIKEQLGYVLHGDKTYYDSLKRVRNKHIANRHSLKNAPYFTLVNDHLISQYRMSSGECLLISLLHFIYNSVIRRSLPQTQPVLLLIDEIELALHPIAVSRLIDLLQETVLGSESFVVILTSHSPEVIRKIDPRKIYKLENNQGNIAVVNPCFPSYAIRDVYRHDGFDYLLLVEDELAKSIINKLLNGSDLLKSRLIHIVPVGGWRNVLKLHEELLSNNILGLGTSIVSILDGDIRESVGQEYNGMKKLFLPIESIEKYLYNVLFFKKDVAVKRVIGDKYFQLRSIDDLVKSFQESDQCTGKQIDKRFFKFLTKDLESRHISIDEFIVNLSGDIIDIVNFDSFKNSLSRLLNLPTSES